MSSFSVVRLLAFFPLIATACGGSGDPSGPSPSSPPLSYLQLFPAEIVAPAGEHVPLQVIARDASGLAVPDVQPAYTSSNAAVVGIENGFIKAIGNGMAIVRAAAGDQTAESIVHVGSATYDLAGLGPPRVLDANYIDLAKIERISRFRSTIGHSYAFGEETCRSMKHYYQPKLTVDWTTVDIYAPAAGTIFHIRRDGAAGFQLLLRPRGLAALNVVLFHVNLDPGIVAGVWVEAGDHIGRHASSHTMSDIAMSIGPTEEGRLLSYFDVMTDAVFAEYQARGVASRQAAIITREQRDADPVPCAGDSQFTVHGKLPDWLMLK